MSGMTSLSTVLSQTLRDAAQSDVLASKAARAYKVQHIWQVVVEICCRPHAQVFLDHTNSVYIIREDDQKVLIVYMDDSIFAAEINARREMIKLKILERFGEEIDDFRILISRGDYKNKHPYSHYQNDTACISSSYTPLSSQEIHHINERASEIENQKVRNSLVKAMISGLEQQSDRKDQKR